MTIDKQKLKALAEAAPYKDWSLSSYEAVGGRAHIVMHGAFDHIITTFEEGSAEFIAAASPSTVLALLAEIERLESEAMHTAAGVQSDREQLGQLKAENELMRAVIGDAATDLRKASAWVCREVEAGTRSATHWAVRLRERADHLDAAMAKEANHG